MTTDTYPARPQYWAARFCRLLTKSAAAQELGPEVCWLLTVIAHQEDVVRYARPVTFYNEQLMPLCGFGGKSRLVLARSKAVSAGWLKYQPGGRGTPGRYWVDVPESLSGLSDSPVCESQIDFCRTESGRQIELEENTVPNQDGNRTVTGRQPDGKPSPFIPIPIPEPYLDIDFEKTKSEPPRKTETRKPAKGPQRFDEFWDAYGKKVAKPKAEAAYSKAVKVIRSSSPEITDPEAYLIEKARQSRELFIRSGNGQQFYPYPTTWLNEGRYSDEITTTNQSNYPLIAEKDIP